MYFILYDATIVNWIYFLISLSAFSLLAYRNKTEPIKVHSWCYTFYIFGQVYNVFIYHYSILRSTFSALCVLPIDPIPHLQALATTVST